MNNIKYYIFLLISKLVPFGAVLPIFKGPLKGLKWVSGAHAGEGKGLSVLMNLFEHEQLNFVDSVIESQDVCLDIGANVGFYTLLYSRKAKKVYAFEPLPRNLFYLYNILNINNCNNTSIVPYAVSDANRLIGFSEGTHNSEGKVSDIGEQPSYITTLDTFVSHFSIKPTLVKIDVEGAEEMLLKGGENTFINNSLKIFLSTHSEELKNNCINILQSYGYSQFKPLNAPIIKGANEFYITK